MRVLERIQIVAFSVQETTLCGLYIYGTMRMAQDSFTCRIRKTISLLMIIQTIAVLCGVMLITLDFYGY